jgi:hypothetical protein
MPNIFDPATLADGTSPLTVTTDALAPSTDLVQAGAVFNDSARLLDSGLWSQPQDAHNQAASLGLYSADLHAALNDVMAMLGNPGSTTIGGAADALSQDDSRVLTDVEGQLQQLIADADSAAAIQAISSGNVAEAAAASQGFIGDAADVSGNHIPIGADAPNPNATLAVATCTAGAAVQSGATGQAIADAAALTAAAAASSTAAGASTDGSEPP